MKLTLRDIEPFVITEVPAFTGSLHVVSNRRGISGVKGVLRAHKASSNSSELTCD